MSSEGAALKQLATAMEVYSRVHKEGQITTWAQASKIFNLNAANRSLRGESSNTLESRYEFTVQSVLLPGLDASRVVLIRTVPLQRANGERKWRHLIARSTTGDFTATRRTEEEVQAMFQHAGVPPPRPKDGVPSTEIESMPDPYEGNAGNSLEYEARSGTPTQSEPNRAAPSHNSSIAQTPRTRVSQIPMWVWFVGGIALIVLGTVLLRNRA